MKEEKKHLYRIDPLKVKQKLYELYPKNSAAHKMMAKEEKIKEYTHLAKTLSSMPLEVVQQVADQNKLLAFNNTVKALLLILGVMSCTALLLMATTKLELFLLGFLGTLSLALALKNFWGAMRIANSLKSFEVAMKKTKDRMDKLQKDIFE